MFTFLFKFYPLIFLTKTETYLPLFSINLSHALEHLTNV